MEIIHTPVLPNEVLQYLAPDRDGALLIDATLGEGGHSELFLQTYPSIHIIALDADSEMLQRARQRLTVFGDRVQCRHVWFDEFFTMYDVPEQPARVLFDLGISMVHFEHAERGFTFRRDQPLDMRLDPGAGPSAADLINTLDQEELTRILFEYGEERYARSIARKVVHARKIESITGTARLASIIASGVPGSYRRGRIHPATRTFQALRIAVNRELDRIEPALSAAFRILEPGGRIGVIAFHSLEDRIVKRFIREKAMACICPPEMPICRCGGVPAAHNLTRRPVRPTEEEIRINPPSRTARFRVLEKIAGGRPE